MSGDDLFVIAFFSCLLLSHAALAIVAFRRERAEKEATLRIVDEMLKNRRTQRQERRDE